VLLWFISLSVLGVVAVFRDPAIDYRLVVAGALLPDLADGVIRWGAGPLHSVLVAMTLLTGVMLGTIGRRLVRRRLLALSVGVFAHLVLDGAWASTSMFWWPVVRGARPRALPSFDHGIAVLVAEEVIGAVALVWAVRRFQLNDRGRRRRFMASGRLDPTLL
jgi:hypothetical protein